jgi:hypothetical protein
MKDTKRHIDKFFQEELGGHTEMPPSSVWENLEKRLDDNQSRPRKAIWWMLSLIAIVFVGGSIAAYYYTHKSNLLDKTSFAQNQSSTLNTEDSKNQNNIESASLNNEEAEFGAYTQPNNEVGNSSTDDNDADYLNANSKDKSSLDGHSKSNDRSNTRNTPTYNKGVLKSKNDSKETLNANDNQNVEEKEGEKKSTLENKNISPNKASSTQLKADAISNKIAQAKKPLLTNKNNQASTKPTEVQNVDSKANTQVEYSSSEKKTSSTNLVNEPKKDKSSLEKPTPLKRVENQKPKPQERGLSAFPEEDAAELLADEAPAKVSPANNIEPAAQQQKLQSKSAQQKATIAQIRAQNPLSAAPVAESAIDESTDENGNQPQESASGGGGGSTAAPKIKSKKPLNMAIGVKMGYERGTQNITAGKYVGSIFTEVSFGKRLSFILQPTIKMASANKQIGLDGLDTFVNADGVTNARYKEYLDSSGKPTGFYDFAYSQQYDSMVQSAISKKKFVEIEIPFLFRYKVDKNFSLLAGMNFIFGKTLGFEISERKLSSSSIQDTILNHFGTIAPSPSSKFFSSGTSGKLDLSTNFAPPINPVRFGYTLGLSYVFKERVMIDLLVQQNLSGISNISNAEVRKIFEQPYVRLSLGYTIFGASKK